MSNEIGNQPAPVEECCNQHVEHDFLPAETLTAVYARLQGKERLFKVSTEGLWDIYLSAFPIGVRQQYNCRACKDFINKYGGLVTINEDGSVKSALWNQDDLLPLSSMATYIETSLRVMVKGMFAYRSTGDILGKPFTGDWSHLAAIAPTTISEKVEFHNQNGFERMMDLASVYHALDTDHVTALLAYGKLLRKELGLVVQHDWISALIKLVKDKTIPQWRKTNLLWLHLSNCHPGWLSVNSLLTTLYDDVIEGYDQDACTARFNAKADPSAFMRPTTAPAEMNVAQAEQFFADNGYAPSLRRRHAKLEDIYHIWTATEVEPAKSSGSLFGHLETKETNNAEPTVVQGGDISLRHFHEALLPTASKIEVLVPPQVPFVNFTAPTDPEAPVITRSKDGISMYAYQKPIPSGVFELQPMTWAELSAVTGIPFDKDIWTNHPNPFLAIDSPAMFGVLKKAKDTNRAVGLGLFPEDMIRELHPYRRVIEAFSAKGLLDGYEESSAASIPLPGARIRVSGKTGNVVEFTITHIR